MHTFEKNCLESAAIPASSTYRTAGEAAGIGVDMAKYNNFCAIIQAEPATQWQGALTCEIAESIDNSTYSDTYLATVTIASSTDTTQIDTVEIRAEELSDGYRYARVEVTPAAGTGNMFDAVNVQFNARFSRD